MNVELLLQAIPRHAEWEDASAALAKLAAVNLAVLDGVRAGMRPTPELALLLEDAANAFLDLSSAVCRRIDHFDS